jgi:hypothetical protein
MRMIEPTEREKKLIEYIMFLIRILNATMLFIANLYRTIDWMEHQFADAKMKETEIEMIDWLKSEFGIPLTVMLDKDVIASNRDTDKHE